MPERMEDHRTTYTFDLTDDQQDALMSVILQGNYRQRDMPNSLCSVDGANFNVTLYAKVRHGLRKLCVQGTGAHDFVEFQLEPNGVIPVALGYEKILKPELFSAHAGSDESGKGDYFGPLVVCCAFTNEGLSDEMQKLGVKDCKQMTDKAVLSVGASLRRLLAWAHGAAIEDLLTKRSDCTRVVVDQFAPTELTIRRALKERGKKAKVEQRHKAESDIAVAAASVIARELFIRDVQKMGDNIPLGSSDPRVRALAEEMVKKNGPTWLMNHCKAHFQTTDKVLAACGKSRADLPPEGQVTSAVRTNSQPVLEEKE